MIKIVFVSLDFAPETLDVGFYILVNLSHFVQLPDFLFYFIFEFLVLFDLRLTLGQLC